MTCLACTDARTSPEHSRLFADRCLFCAARRIQYIQRCLPIGRSQKVERCRTALSQAVALGLPEESIRSMAKLAAWQLEPVESSASRPKHGG